MCLRLLKVVTNRLAGKLLRVHVPTLVDLICLEKKEQLQLVLPYEADDIVTTIQMQQSKPNLEEVVNKVFCSNKVCNLGTHSSRSCTGLLNPSWRFTSG